MLLTVRVDNPPPPAQSASGGRTGRRDAIYPHRSVRALPMSNVRLWAGVALALLITVFSVLYAVPIMEAHSRVAAVLAGWAGLPVSGWAPVGVFPGLEPASGPVLAIPTFGEVNEGARLALLLSIVGLLIVAQRFSLFRNVANFLIVLLVASGRPASQYGRRENVGGGWYQPSAQCTRGNFARSGWCSGRSGRGSHPACWVNFARGGKSV